MSITVSPYETPHMSTLIFDTLAYTKKLRAAGVPEIQAEAHAEAIAEVIQEKLATKQDIKKLERDLRHEIKEMGHKLTIRLGGIVIGGISVLAILIKIL